MVKPKKLIEVAMPIKEISAASVHDKYIHHGHISTLHIWWARRPLPVCRAVVFASLVHDPLDSNCPQVFKDAVEILLGKNNNVGDPYHPYLDIPWTAVYDPVEDNLRNRLQMFIGKFTNNMQQALLHNKPIPPAGKVLDDGSLIKWENRNDQVVINKARKLIWVAHNCESLINKSTTAERLILDFDNHYEAIQDAEQKLYNLTDRHLQTGQCDILTEKLHRAIELFLDKMPTVFDPFAGGGAIPLEAARLGCRTFGNDINPVAHIIQKGSLEFPQKFGKPITFSKESFVKQYGYDLWGKQPQIDRIVINGETVAVKIENRLAFDVEIYAKRLLAKLEEKISTLYPVDKDGNKPIVYYWVKVGICTNPSCKAKVPLLKQFYLANKPNKKIYLNPIIKGNEIAFEIKNGSYNEDGWTLKSNLKCPICHNVTPAKEIQRQYKENEITDRLIAVIEESSNGKKYRIPSPDELKIVCNNKSLLDKINIPNEKLPTALTGGSIMSWGAKEWSQMFSVRQLIVIDALVEQLKEIKAELNVKENEYSKAIILYLSIWIDRIASYSTSFGRWIPQNEQVASVFGRQAIAMIFDYPEVSVFSPSTSGALNQLEWILLYLKSENISPFQVTCINASSGEKEQFKPKSITAVITDPPYYDAIAYADLSDFFYVWLKRTLGDVYPLNFATPQTPKSDECTALRHVHGGKVDIAKKHFEGKLFQIFDAIEHQTSDIISIMFAHQSTEAWTTLCNSILNARMNITGSWAIDSERDTRMVAIGTSALQSSVTVSCKPSVKKGFGDYKEVKKAIEKTVSNEVDKLYDLGFRGADLLTACFGQAVSEFGKYEKVEKADGSEVKVADLLEMARESAFNALLKGFVGDDFSKFYIGWLQLFGFAESDFDDAAKFSRVGLTINVSELFTEHILIKNGNKQTLGTFEQRVSVNKNIGDKSSDNLIDQAHKAMALYKGNNRSLLLQFIRKIASQPESNFWRVITSLCEVLPNTSEDYKQAIGLLTNKDSLIRESKNIQTAVSAQTNLFE